MHAEARVSQTALPLHKNALYGDRHDRKGTEVIRPIEAGGEKRLITSCPEKMSKATGIKHS